tara:strand:+ start:69 stop:503 length:435 start_codon:yes stop_codon:yes gene_type:complete
MVTFKNNNNRRNNFRRSDRNFKTNGDRPKYGSNFSNNENFKRKLPGRNNHNAPKLIEKYNDLAREALSNGDKILSENYLQHADHFTRILNERESYKKDKILEKKFEESENTPEIKSEIDNNSDVNLVKGSKNENEGDKEVKSQL